MRDRARTNAEGVGKSLGYGFVRFTSHQHALDALRRTNNNPEIFGENKVVKGVFACVVFDWNKKT